MTGAVLVGIAGAGHVIARAIHVSIYMSVSTYRHVYTDMYGTCNHMSGTCNADKYGTCHQQDAPSRIHWLIL